MSKGERRREEGGERRGTVSRRQQVGRQDWGACGWRAEVPMHIQTGRMRDVFTQADQAAERTAARCTRTDAPRPRSQMGDQGSPQ
eukprot:1041701-Rhodomonas_salina.1